MVVLFVLLLLGCAHAQFAPLHMGKGKKMTPEDFRKIPDDPFSDPADDIPPVPQNAKPGDSPASLGLLPKSPRDQYLEEENNKAPKPNIPRAGDSILINFEQLHDKLIEEQARPDAVTRKPYRQQGYTANVPPESDKMYKEKFSEFEPHGFGLKLDNIFRNATLKYMKPIVWSTCDDLKRGGRIFNPEDIVNIMWIPFYSWSETMEVVALVHKFTIPTVMQVYQYHNKFAPYLNRTIDWNQPKLHFDQDFGYRTALLIAADKTGLFFMVFNIETPEYVQRHNITSPIFTVRLKIVGRYLAVMYCEHSYAMIMARDGEVPATNKDKRETAKILGFRGKGRPINRDEDDEQERKHIAEDRKRTLEALKYLPTDGSGYLDGIVAKERPIGRRRKTEEDKNKFTFRPDRAKAL